MYRYLVKNEYALTLDKALSSCIILLNFVLLDKLRL